MTVALAIAFEAFTIWMIRDGLALNVLMLLYPLTGSRNGRRAVRRGRKFLRRNLQNPSKDFVIAPHPRVFMGGDHLTRTSPNPIR